MSILSLRSELTCRCTPTQQVPDHDSFGLTRSLLTRSPLHLPGIWRTSLSDRSSHKIWRGRTPYCPMPSQPRSLQHTLRWTQPRRFSPLHPRRLLPVKLQPGYPPLLGRFPGFTRDSHSANVYRGCPKRPLHNPSISGHPGFLLPDTRRRCHLPMLLARLDSLRTHPHGPRSGED
jgi:hypothetical protein